VLRNKENGIPDHQIAVGDADFDDDETLWSGMIKPKEEGRDDPEVGMDAAMTRKP